MPPLILALLLALFAQSSSAEDLTHLVDVYRDRSGVIYTNTSEIPLRCQISSKVDPNLPFGTLAEKRNITLRGYLSYTHNRFPTEQIIYCTRLIKEQDNAAHDRLSD
jgi:hypothetical protein